ncbi:MAG: permease [Clostridia bacterium]
MKKKLNLTNVVIIVYAIFIAYSLITKLETGINIFNNFKSFTIEMIKILPCAFILIGLIEVWIKHETVEKYFGQSSGLLGHFWAIILSSTTVGGAYVAFPLGHTLFTKGARLSIVLTYIGSAGLTRVPMTIFEASFLGVKFTLTRLLVSVPLVIISSIILEKISDTEKIPKEIKN